MCRERGRRQHWRWVGKRSQGANPCTIIQLCALLRQKVKRNRRWLQNRYKICRSQMDSYSRETEIWRAICTKEKQLLWWKYCKRKSKLCLLAGEVLAGSFPFWWHCWTSAFTAQTVRVSTPPDVWWGYLFSKWRPIHHKLAYFLCWCSGNLWDHLGFPFSAKKKPFA